jgi:transcriptional regulator with XRE-family HTH domain
MTKTAVIQFTEDPEGMRLFQQERLVTEVTELICKTMKDQRIKRSELAERLTKTRGRVSQILNGNERNLTLRTVADIFTALGKTLTVSAEDLAVEEGFFPLISFALEMKPWIGSPWELSESIPEPSNRCAALAG